MCVWSLMTLLINVSSISSMARTHTHTRKTHRSNSSVCRSFRSTLQKTNSPVSSEEYTALSCTNGIGQGIDSGGSRGAVNNLVGMFECRGRPPLIPAGEKGQDYPTAEHRTPPPVSKFRRKPSKPESKAQKLASPANQKKQLGFLHKQASAPDRSDPPKMPGKVPILPPPAPKAVKSQATSSGPSKSTASSVTTTAISRPVPVMASSERQNPPRGAKVGGAKVGAASVGIAAIMQNFEFQPRKVNRGDSHQKPSREEKFTASEPSPKILKKRPSHEKFAPSVAVDAGTPQDSKSFYFPYRPVVASFPAPHHIRLHESCHRAWDLKLHARGHDFTT